MCKKCKLYRDALMDMVNQFSDYAIKDGILQRNTMGLSALEHAFDVLGLDDPHPCPEHECQVRGCHEMARCGYPSPTGYMWVCGKHYRKRRT